MYEAGVLNEVDNPLPAAERAASAGVSAGGITNTSLFAWSVKPKPVSAADFSTASATRKFESDIRSSREGDRDSASIIDAAPAAAGPESFVAYSGLSASIVRPIWAALFHISPLPSVALKSSDAIPSNAAALFCCA